MWIWFIYVHIRLYIQVYDAWLIGKSFMFKDTYLFRFLQDLSKSTGRQRVNGISFFRPLAIGDNNPSHLLKF